jgi:hypothetical protein
MRLFMNCRSTQLAMMLGALAGAAPAALAGPLAADPISVNAASDACSNATVEAALRQRDTALLGATHANDHALARAYQCKAAKGAAIMPAPDYQALAVSREQTSDAVGGWSAPFGIPVVGITSVLLNNGKVLFWSYDPSQYGLPNGTNTGVAYLWDPVTRSGTPLTPPANIWCAGQTILGDGRVFLAGGNLRYPDPNAAPGTTGYEGALSTYTFNPANNTWTRQPDMTHGRWYPTVTQLADNRAVITSGYDETGTQALNQAIELFTPAAAADGVGTIASVATHSPTGFYPFQYLMPTGQMLQAGPYFGNTVLLTPSTWALSAIPNMRSSHYAYGNGISYTDASIAPTRQSIIISGGADSTGAISNNEWLDSVNPGAGWRSFPQWLQARHNGNTVILPDGTLLTVGGNSASNTYDGTLFESELYNKPAIDISGQWVRVASNSIPAAYHSSAILLPDATVLLSEDDRNPGAASSHRAQIYSPPYLFKGARPNITSAPNAASSGQTVLVTADVSNIAFVALLAPGATTHGNDMHQRFVKLPIVKDGTNIKVTIPSSKALVPPGYYMLFIVDPRGVPSVAKFVRVS